DREHVVRPHAEADKADADGGGDHRRIAEDGLARKDGDDLVGKREGRQNEDVNLRMPEYPEEVHPEHRGAAGLRIEEVRAQVAIEQQHDLSRSEWADSDEDHTGHHEIEPYQQGHASELHAGTAHAERGRHYIKGGADAADAAEQDRESPVVSAVPRREGTSREGCVGPPANVGCAASSIETAAAQVAEVQEKPTQAGDPEAEGVQPREGHVTRADHQRDQIIAEAEEDRHSYEEDHGGAVHGEQLIEDLRRHEVVVGDG